MGKLQLPPRPSIRDWKDEYFLSRKWKWIQDKLDGVFVYVVKDQHGLVGIFSKTPSNFTDYLRDDPIYQNALLVLPRTSIIIGELYVPGKKAAAVKTHLAEKTGECRFAAFGVSILGGKEIGCSEPLPTVASAVSAYGIQFAHYEDWQGKFPKQRRGVEGYVLKNGNMLDWCRYKYTRTIDLIITGFNPGNKKYIFTLGSLELSTAEGKVLCDCSGMTDAHRDYFWSNRKELLGKVVEVKYDRVDAQGRLRFPRFVRIRDDKHPAYCTLSQDPEVEEIWASKNTTR